MSIHVLDAMAREGFELVMALHDRRSRLRGFLGIHDSTQGPAFGGIRRWSYQTEDQALRDCLRLARAMTHKCALTGLPAGGGKLVVIDRHDMDVEAAYEYVGDVLRSLNGRFHSGPDVGTGERELAWVANRTAAVTRPEPYGPGLLAEATCAGVVHGIAAALRHLDGSEDWTSRTIVVQGLGEVGSRSQPQSLQPIDHLPHRDQLLGRVKVGGGGDELIEGRTCLIDDVRTRWERVPAALPRHRPSRLRRLVAGSIGVNVAHQVSLG